MMKTTNALFLLSQAAAHLGVDDHMVAVPMTQYKRACGLPSNLSVVPQMASQMAAFLQGSKVPGAGIDEFTSFKTVHKDGFMAIDCVKDYMYYNGDKFGDNKHDYKLGATSNVSIVHYNAFVPKEDQEPMTQKVCFEFCRTVPNMGFFGVVNGRGCYCTPYFEPMESDSSSCDAVCEGDTTLMCGGKAKSSIFSMHMCASTGSDLKEVSGKAGTLKASMDAKYTKATGLAKDMQDTGTTLQKTFGKVGDSGATGLMQDAKVFAGEVEKQTKAVKAITDKLGGLIKEAKGMTKFEDPAVVTKAEGNMEATEETIAEGVAAEDALDKLIELAEEASVADAAKQYYPVMYFVDKKYESVPSTCGGATVEKPIVQSSKDGCAAACDASIHSCVGFQYFESGSKLCFLFSKFQSAFYYTGCKKGSFLETMKKEKEAICYAKLSKFEGTSLKVDKSGKTDFGMKEITKADRCFY